jgi:CheY-like chemotaxis protein
MKTLAHRILLVDDDLGEQFLTGRALEKVMPVGSSVHIVGSGNEAIAYMIGEGVFADRERHPFPTLVITDLKMTDGDGFSVLEFMQANPGWSVVPRVMYSTSDDPDDIRTSYLLGASVYHKKGGIHSEQMRNILEYWATSEVPPVDETGRLLVTCQTGRAGARYLQPKAGARMRRPGQPSTEGDQAKETDRSRRRRAGQ